MESKELVKLIRKAEGGDEDAFALVRRETTGAGVWNTYRGLAEVAEAALLTVASGHNLMVREAWKHKASELRAKLAGPDPTPLERVLVERAVACWMQASYADMRMSEALSANCRLTVGDFWRKQQDSAHKRLLAAVKTLALVRRLALPVLLAQINRAEQQVNIAGKVSAGAPPTLPAGPDG